MLRLLRGFSILCFILATVPPHAPFAQEAGQAEFLQIRSLTGVRGGNLVVAVTSDPSNFNRMLTSGLANTAITETVR
jgi:hypothetical protein